MNKEKIKLLGEYIKARVSTILIEEIPDTVIKKGAVVIDANCTNEELNGAFQNMEYKPPEWYVKLVESSKKHTPVLIIKDINKIPKQEQRKFIELLKYKKVYVNNLPEKCMIFATYSNIDENPIEEEVYSFMVHI